MPLRALKRKWGVHQFPERIGLHTVQCAAAEHRLMGQALLHRFAHLPMPHFNAPLLGFAVQKSLHFAPYVVGLAAPHDHPQQAVPRLGQPPSRQSRR